MFQSFSSRARLFSALTFCAGLTLSAAASEGPSPGETSGAPLAPLLVPEYDKDSGDMRLSYQSACGATDNNIYYGPLSQISRLGWSGSVCGIGTSGSHAGFNPGPGSYFFLIVGNDGTREGSYGHSQQGGTSTERPPYQGNTCGEVQQLASACSPSPTGGACSSSADCAARQTCVLDAAGAAACVCLPPFSGEFCQACAPGYAGVDCRECAAGYSSNVMELASESEAYEDMTNPLRFECRLDLATTCVDVHCSPHGTCQTVEQEASCVCETGYSGKECSECLPNYEHTAVGTCILGGLCREAKCGGHGNCVDTSFGEVACACDAGYSGTDCGGPALAIRTNSETLTLYSGQSIVLEPLGGTGPYSWQVVQGPAQITDCVPRLDPTCPMGGVRLTVVASPTSLQDLTLIKVKLMTAGGGQTSGNYAAVPATMVPFTGAIHEELMPYYRSMLTYMRARGIRAGTLGISKGGVLLGVNGYGYRDSGLDADPWVNANEGGPLVQPNSPFRLGSVSKVLTAGAVRGAAADAGVNTASSLNGNGAANWIDESIGYDPRWDEPPFDYNTGDTADPRWNAVTINNLLNHHAGYYRDGDSVAVSAEHPAYNGDLLPYTQDLLDPDELQTLPGANSADISTDMTYALAALQASGDPRPTDDKIIRFSAGIRFHYSPGGPVDTSRSYSNLGYIMLSRILEGLRGRTYDPDEPGVPMGWGAYPKLLQEFLCEESGIHDGVYPGDAFHPLPLEPYYRSILSNGTEQEDWNMAEGAVKIRFNEGNQQWQFCQTGCGGQFPSWSLDYNTRRAYGGVWLAERNGAGGLVANMTALLKYARNRRVKAGSPFESADIGIGAPLLTPGTYPKNMSHAGQTSGGRAWIVQWGGGWRPNKIPLPTRTWTPDPTETVLHDLDNKVVISEFLVGSGCIMPDDVALAVAFDQDADQRAPWDNVSPLSGNNTVSTIYGRIMDYLGDATCQVKLAGWPALGELPPQQLVQPCP